MANYTEAESRVIKELENSYDPILMNEQEVWIEFNRIANIFRIEAEDVKRICEKWQFDKIRKDMEEISKSVNTKKDDYQVYQEDDGYQD
jgi:uncharacterized membrane protein YgaE (UPF0421/DUF939 family)